MHVANLNLDDQSDLCLSPEQRCCAEPALVRLIQEYSEAAAD